MKEVENLEIATDCPHCKGKELYTRRVSSAGGEGPYLLQGLGHFLHYADFDVVLCADCGLTRFFAEPDARVNVRTNSGWKKL